MYKSVTLALSFLLLAACTSPVKKPQPSGFLSDYSRLSTIDQRKNLLGYHSEALMSYRKVIIDPVVMVYQRDQHMPNFTPQELQELQEFAQQSLIAAFNDQKSAILVVNEPATDVARLRIAITDVKKTIGALNVAIYTKVTGAGLGGVAIEGEMLDSISGEQLAAGIHWGSGSRLLRAGFTKTGDAKILLKKWSRELRDQLSALVDNQV